MTDPRDRRRCAGGDEKPEPFEPHDWANRIERAMEREDETVDQATPWTDDQCIEFACVAFRHAKKNLPKGVTLDDIRLGAIRVGHMTMQNVTRKNEQSVMRALAEFIAESSYPDDPRLEVAYAIARHLNLGWPSADSAMAASAVPVVTYTTGHCKNNAQPGGCQLHNLQCGYPSCDRQPVIPPAVPVESLGREAAPYSAPFTTDVRNCCESPETCPEPCGVPPASVPESPEDRFEQFVQAEIARSPKPLQDLGEYLARVLDEDKFPAANRLLLQLAVEHKTTPPPANVPDGACPRCNGEKEGYLLDGDGPYLCNACYDTPPTTPEESP